MRHHSFARLAGAVLVAGAVLFAATPALAGDDHSVAEPVVVKLASDRSGAIEALASAYGFTVIETILPSRGIHRITFGVGADGKKEAKELAKDDAVLWAEREEAEDGTEDTRFHAWPAAPPPLLEDERVDGVVAADQHLLEVHEVTTGAGTVVAILDTGVDFDHPVIRDRLIGGYDYVDDDADPTDVADGVDSDADGGIDEAFGHGTHVAGIVAQVAPDAALVAMRVLDADGRGDIYRTLEAISDAVAMDVDVINLSFGATAKVESKLLAEAIKQADEAGVVVVAAAGNTGDDEKRYPASRGEVLSVAASRSDGSLPEFASFGKWVDVTAPGTGIVSAFPGGGYARWSGSSMAVPFVSGQAALLLAVDPEADAKDVAKAIRDSSRKPPEGKRRADKGLIDLLASIERMR